MHYAGLTPQVSATLRAGGPDAFGNAAEHAVSDGTGTPCRHCLRIVPEGEAYLIAAHKPFSTTQPYSEIGPIFLCERDCPAPSDGVPDVLVASPSYLLKAYSADERIIYGTGAITPVGEVEGYAASLLGRPDVAFVDVRSAKNNCWLTRITRR